jgi:hypothetical protein
MDILIKTSDGSEVQRWSSPPDKVSIPNTSDVISPVPDDRPLAIGPDHFLATATVVDADAGAGNDQKCGPEVVSVVGQEVTVTRTTIDRDAYDYMADWEVDMASATRYMPDSVEAVIDSMNEDQLGKLDHTVKEYFAAKKTAREARPS